MAKVWLVTGSARGLGREIVEAALQAGEQVVATARDPRQLADLSARHGERVRAIALDVTDPQAARQAVQAAVDAFGRLDVVVNNAGFGHLVPFEQSSEDDFRAQIDTNFYGVVNVTRAALPVLRQQRAGHIIQISSVGGRVGMAGLSAYQAAKWAVGGFTEVIRQELAPFGVHVTALEPGGMKTEWGHQAAGATPELWPDYVPSVGAVSGYAVAVHRPRSQRSCEGRTGGSQTRLSRCLAGASFAGQRRIALLWRRREGARGRRSSVARGQRVDGFFRAVAAACVAERIG